MYLINIHILNSIFLINLLLLIPFFSFFFTNNQTFFEFNLIFKKTVHGILWLY